MYDITIIDVNIWTTIWEIGIVSEQSSLTIILFPKINNTRANKFNPSSNNPNRFDSGIVYNFVTTL